MSNTSYSGSHYLCLMVNHFGMCCMGHYPEYLEDNSSNLEKRNRVDNGLLLSDESSTESKTGPRTVDQPKIRPKMFASVSPQWASN